MAELKRIPKELAGEALQKALRYRLLNEPLEAESICRDVLAVEPDNQQALITLLLALTDQFDTVFTPALNEAQEVVDQLQGEYEQAYYQGIMHERWAGAQLARDMPPNFAIEWFRRAMQCYEQAEQLAKPNDPDALLRYNTCARYLQKHETPGEQNVSMTHDVISEFGDDVPLR